MRETALPIHKRINTHRTAKSGCEYMTKYFRNDHVRSSFSIQILEIFEGDSHVNGKVCPIPITGKKILERKDHWMKTLRTKYPYGLNDIARDEDTKPVGLQFPSISRGAARTVRPRTKLVPTANTADAIFEQIHLIIDSDIKNAYFHIRVILNTVKKKMLKQLAAGILYGNNNPTIESRSILHLHA